MKPDREKELDAIIKEYGPRLTRYAAIRLGADAAMAEDAIQHTMMRLWSLWGSLDGDKKKLRAWIYAVFRNAVIDMKRARRRERQLTDEHRSPQTKDQPEERTTEKVISEFVWELLDDELTGAQDQAVTLLLSGLSSAEAAEKLGIPANAVRSRKKTALPKMRKAAFMLQVLKTSAYLLTNPLQNGDILGGRAERPLVASPAIGTLSRLIAYAVLAQYGCDLLKKRAALLSDDVFMKIDHALEGLAKDSNASIAVMTSSEKRLFAGYGIAGKTLLAIADLMESPHRAADVFCKAERKRRGLAQNKSG